MKRYIFALLMIFVAINCVAQVNGQLNTIGDKKILHVWGDHYQRGFAQGYILAAETWEVYHDYFYQWVTASNSTVYNSLLSVVQDRFSVDQRYINEANGILDGMQAAGQSIYHPAFARDIDVDDIMVSNAIVDLRSLRADLMGDELSLGCASISSWGASTMADSTLAGSIVISRLMDWDRNSHLLANPIMIVHHPSEIDEQAWISFTYPGFMGALSAISASNSAAFLNVSNVNSNQYSTDLKHVLFSVRDGIERLDYNGDGIHNGEDIHDSIADNRHLSGTLVHVISEVQDDIYAGIVENNWYGTALRKKIHNQNLPGDNLAVTNHFRLLYNPICCGRYEAIIDSFLVDPTAGAKRQLSLLYGAAGWENNLMAMQYVPSSGNIIWTNATSTLPAYQAPAIGLNTAVLFDFLSTSTPEEPIVKPLIKLSPNPIRSQGFVSLHSDKAISRLVIYNMRGQKLYEHPYPNGSKSLSCDIRGLANGVYQMRIIHEGGKTHTKRFSVIR